MQNDLTLWTKAELAERIGRSIQTISADVMKRKIPYVKIGRHVRFRPSDIESWLAEKSVGVKAR